MQHIQVGNETDKHSQNCMTNKKKRDIRQSKDAIMHWHGKQKALFKSYTSTNGLKLQSLSLLSLSKGQEQVRGASDYDHRVIKRSFIKRQNGSTLG